jgi:hypothetical protein
MIPAADDELELEWIMAQYLLDCDLGKAVDAQAMLGQHPKWHSQLNEFILNHQRSIEAANNARRQIET